jgi:hypothetical protein
MARETGHFYFRRSDDDLKFISISDIVGCA